MWCFLNNLRQSFQTRILNFVFYLLLGFYEEPMTVNVVFISDQRVLAPKRTAIFRSRILNHFGMTTCYSLYPHSILSAFSLVTIHENDGILDEERRTWTRSVGTKNRSSRRTDYPRRAENRSTVNQVLLLFPTTNPLPPTPFLCFFLQLASWN